MRATGFPPTVRQLIVERSSGRCEVMAAGCTFTATAIHHRRPRGMGGSRRPDTNLASNGLATCDSCHRYIESLRDESHSRGWLVMQNQSPAAIPAVHRGQWALLLDDGSVQSGVRA